MVMTTVIRNPDPTQPFDQMDHPVYLVSYLSAVQPHGLRREVVKLLPVELRRPRLVLLLRVVRHAVVLPEEVGESDEVLIVLSFLREIGHIYRDGLKIGP